MVIEALRRASDKLQWFHNKSSFDRIARRVRNTRPLELYGDSPIFLSMVSRQDLNAYLLAIKSLYRGVGQGRVVVINERSFVNQHSLNSEDMAILNYHVPGIEVIDLAGISTGCCPRGGTWERLVKIVELSADNYVIQADADTLVSKPISEVVQCWRENRSFLMGTRFGQQISTAAETAGMVRAWIKEHGWGFLPLCVIAEASLDQLAGAAHLPYVHASSGFAGFARGAFALADLECFSENMIKLLGTDRWNEWGSEQISSNYMLANAPGAAVLPVPKYSCFEPHVNPADAAVLHFIGQYRYYKGIYGRRAAKFIEHY